MKLHQHMTSTGRQYAFICPCGWTSETRYTVEAAGRDVDLHMAERFRNPTERKLCEPIAFICRTPDGIPEE